MGSFVSLIMIVRQVNPDACGRGSNWHGSLKFRDPDNIITDVLPAGLQPS